MAEEKHPELPAHTKKGGGDRTGGKKGGGRLATGNRWTAVC